MKVPKASQAVTAKGQITLKRDLLQHLGIKLGERMDFEKLPGDEQQLRAARSTAFFACLQARPTRWRPSKESTRRHPRVGLEQSEGHG
jgi:hypothetical protein